VTEMLSTAAIPPMALAAVASTELVRVVLGSSWVAAAPILSVLAVAGARETALQGTQSLMRAMGRGKLILRYELAAAVVQLTGIVVGLQFGVLGVAVGLTAAGFALTPALLMIQKRLAGLSYRVQLGAFAPGVHSSLWGVLAYLAVELTDQGALLTLVLGTLAYGAVALLVLRLVHPSTWSRVVGSGFRVGGGGPA
jgi:O-antigen/teichoic acid export membrane protein